MSHPVEASVGTGALLRRSTKVFWGERLLQIERAGRLLGHASGRAHAARRVAVKLLRAIVVLQVLGACLMAGLPGNQVGLLGVQVAITLGVAFLSPWAATGARRAFVVATSIVAVEFVIRVVASLFGESTIGPMGVVLRLVLLGFLMRSVRSFLELAPVEPDGEVVTQG